MHAVEEPLPVAAPHQPPQLKPSSKARWTTSSGRSVTILPDFIRLRFQLRSKAMPHEWFDGVSVSVPSVRFMGRLLYPPHEAGSRSYPTTTAVSSTASTSGAMTSRTRTRTWPPPSG